MSVSVGIIGGGGWLGGAIAARGLSGGVLAPSSLIVSGRSHRSERFAPWPDVAWTSDNSELANRSDVVIVSVRPEQFGAIALDFTSKLVISVMAGVSMATLQRKLNAERVVRTMPNAAAEIGRSYTPWVASEAVTADDRAFVTALFSQCGTEDEVETETQLDYLTGLSGSGPAFPALLAKAMIEHAEASGLPAHIAAKAVREVVCGASQLIDNEAFDAVEMVKTFVDYRGTTAAGIIAMEDAGLSNAVGAGLTAAAAAAADMAAKYDR